MEPLHKLLLVSGINCYNYIKVKHMTLWHLNV